MKKDLQTAQTVCRFEAMGTLNEITVFGEYGRALVQAEARVREIDARMSVFRPESDIAKLNAAAGNGAVSLHADTLKLLKSAKNLAVRSGGAFDVTICPLAALWGIGRKQAEHIPPALAIRRTKRLVNSRTLVCSDERSTAFLKKAGQAVDLGGIAKGYAADEVRRILKENGAQSALINLGGNIVTVGVRPDRRPWNIGIQNPLAPRGEPLGTLKIADGSVVTSGVNERFFIQNGLRCHHLIDPRTGWPAQSGILSVTVVCDCSLYADALSTALFILGIRGLPLLREYDADAVFVMEDGRLFATQGLADRFEHSFTADEPKRKTYEQVQA